MTALVTHSALLTRRSLTVLVRQPAYLLITLIQPMIWLLLFGQLFGKVIEIPGFESDGQSFMAFLTPGVVMMTALFSAAWAGTTFIEDMGLGVMDRMLASPVKRGALVNGTVIYQGIVSVAQTAVVLVVAYAAGARFGAPVTGVVLTILAAVLLTVVFAALSNALALLTRQQETLIGVSQLLGLPLTFLSSAIMDPRLMPEWIQNVARYNPLDWAVLVSRESLSATPDWNVHHDERQRAPRLAIVMSCWRRRRSGRTGSRSESPEVGVGLRGTVAPWPTPTPGRRGSPSTSSTQWAARCPRRWA
jgi:ABC-2 type transport system permease protein